MQNDGMRYWQDYRREQELARLEGRSFRLSPREYAALRDEEQSVKAQSREWRRVALRNLFARGSGHSFAARAKASLRVLDDTVRADAQASDRLRRSVARGINPAAVDVTPASASFGAEEQEAIQRSWTLPTVGRTYGTSARGGQGSSARACGAPTTKGWKCSKPRPCPYHGGR